MTAELNEGSQPQKTISRFLTDVETRLRVFAVAAQLFAERGYQKVTVRAICGLAGTNVA